MNFHVKMSKCFHFRAENCQNFGFSGRNFQQTFSGKNISALVISDYYLIVQVGPSGSLIALECPNGQQSIVMAQKDPNRTFRKKESEQKVNLNNLNKKPFHLFVSTTSLSRYGHHQVKSSRCHQSGHRSIKPTDRFF